MRTLRGWVGLTLAVAAAAAGMGLVAGAQEGMPKAKVSGQPLTAEQLAVYRGFFTSWFKEQPAEANLSEVTVPIDEDDAGSDGRCAAQEDAAPAPRWCIVSGPRTQASLACLSCG